MKRNSLNLILDVILLLLLAAISGIGILIKYIMPSNYSVRREGVVSYASDVMGMNRHGWGAIHWALSLIYLFLLLVHIVLHWRMIINTFNRMIPDRIICNIICGVILTLVILFIALPFVFML